MVPDSARSGHLDAARAFAALLVFSSHARGIFLSPWRASVGFMAGAVLKGGHAVSAVAPVQALKPSHQAVIIFFVLSGYFVGGSVMRSVTARNWSWRIYLSKRLVRLWLVLIPALILTLVLDGIGRHYAPTGALYSYAGANTPMLIDSDDLRTFFGNLFFVQGILTPALGSNDPLWSLAYEFWYYAAFPCLMLAIGASGISRRIVYLIALCVILFFVGREISLYFLVWLLGLAPHLLPRPKRQTSRWIVLGGACLLAGVAVELIKAGIGIFFADVILAMAFSGWCYLASNTAPGVRGSLYGRLSSRLLKNP
jgi:peptidoglycan/LPS O-acetylase OafA/YrhL